MEEWNDGILQVQTAVLVAWLIIGKKACSASTAIRAENVCPVSITRFSIGFDSQDFEDSLKFVVAEEGDF